MESTQVSEHRAPNTKRGRSKRRLNAKQHNKPMEASTAPFVKGHLGTLVPLRLSLDAQKTGPRGVQKRRGKDRVEECKQPDCQYRDPLGCVSRAECLLCEPRPEAQPLVNL